MPFNAKCPGCNASIDLCGCNDPNTNITSSNDVRYIGPTLLGTGIQNCDTLSVALQKIDYAILQLQGSTTTTTSTSTTTTTSTSTTTTTTTTAIPGEFLVLESGLEDYLLQESGDRILL